jgi:hypothetical protein
MKTLYLIIISIMIYNAPEPIKDKIARDNVLIAPGIGAEAIILRSSAKSLIAQKGNPEKISEFKKDMELFNDIFHKQSELKIYFNKIYYYQSMGFIVFIYNDDIVAIAGLNNNRITTESINLSNGIEYFFV